MQPNQKVHVKVRACIIDMIKIDRQLTPSFCHSKLHCMQCINNDLKIYLVLLKKVIAIWGKLSSTALVILVLENWPQNRNNFLKNK